MEEIDRESREIRRTARETLNELVTPVKVEDLIIPVGEAVIQGYKEVYELFSKPVERDTTPPEYYDLKTDEERSAFLAQLKAYEKAQVPLAEKYGFSLLPARYRVRTIKERESQPMNRTPIRVCVTGASGQLGYALVFRIACGAVFGPHQPVQLQLLELPAAQQQLEGVVMELKDCAFPTLYSVESTSQADRAFDGIDYALLVGAMPRGPGMERADLLHKNAEIFSAQGKALNSHAKGAQTRVIVVGNPANTNCLIASHNAPNIPTSNFSALTRLDHNRGLAQLALKANCEVSDIQRFIIWGNHSATMVPDITHAKIEGKLATEIFTDKEWLQKTFTPTVQKRGAAIIAARGVSSAASAANAVVDACADWHFGTHAQWTSAAHHSNGEYGVTKGLFYSYPIVYNEKREWDIVRNLPIDEATANAMEASHKELLEERDAVSKLLKE